MRWHILEMIIILKRSFQVIWNSRRNRKLKLKEPGNVEPVMFTGFNTDVTQEAGLQALVDGLGVVETVLQCLKIVCAMKFQENVQQGMGGIKTVCFNELCLNSEIVNGNMSFISSQDKNGSLL